MRGTNQYSRAGERTGQQPGESARPAQPVDELSVNDRQALLTGAGRPDKGLLRIHLHTGLHCYFCSNVIVSSERRRLSIG